MKTAMKAAMKAAMRAVRSLSLAALGLLVACAGQGNFSPMPPPLGGAPKMWMPNFTTNRLPNGIPVAVNSDGYLPMVSIAVGLKGGALADAPERAGLTLLTMRAMLARTEKFDRLQLAASFDAVGGLPRTRVMPDGVVLQLDVLEDRAEGALMLLAEILQRPGLTEEELARLKQELLSDQTDVVSDPDYAAMVGMRKVLLGPQHPLGNPNAGTRQSVERFTLADVQRRHAQLAQPRNVSLVIAGRVGDKDALAAAGQYFGTWAAPAAAIPAPTTPPPVATPSPDRKRIHYIARPGLSQTLILVGTVGLPEGHADRHLLRIVAGRVPGRASAWLRGIEQVTYGVGYVEEVSSQVGWFGARMAVDVRATGTALKTLLDRYDDNSGGWFDIEKVSLLTGLGMPYYSIVGRTMEVASLEARGLPADHWIRLRQTLDDTRDYGLGDLTFRYLDSDHMQVVLVGDPDAIKTQLREVGLGPVEQLSIDPS